MKNSWKLAGLGLATTLALAVQSSAQAYDFTFSGFTAGGSFSASGTFTINDSTPQGAITASDFEDYEIILDNGSGSTFTLDPSNSAFNFNFGYTNNATFDSSALTFTSNWWINNPASGSPFTNALGQYQTSNDFLYFNGSRELQTHSTFLTATRTTPTAVPFGAKTDLSILILGGLYGASRLRKTIAARKQISNQEA